uniref:DUF1404 domain-containing protein n=1 Tax=Thermofilum pendens TaxID=2269 RepID=A0A7C4FEV7_THEPE
MRSSTSFLAIVAPAIVSTVFVAVPLESLLSTYPVPIFAFYWYIPWRGAVVSLTLWLVTGILYSDKRYYLKLSFLGSAVTFAAYHYLTLFLINLRSPVRPSLLFYLVGDNSPLFLDVGQVVLILTALAFRRELKLVLRSFRAPAGSRE